MASFKGFIQINGKGCFNPALFEQKVIEVLFQIIRRDVGFLVLREIQRAKQIPTIIPAAGIFDSAANPRDSQPWILVQGVKRYPQMQDYPNVDKKKWDSCVLPTLKPDIEYLPGNWSEQKKGAQLLNTEPFFPPDEVLLHELFHKVRFMQGLTCNIPTDDPYGNLEEFFAILITNIYISAKGCDTRLRASHFIPLFERLTMNDNEFWLKYFSRIERLVKEMDSFCGFLSAINCKFNPLRRHSDYMIAIRTALDAEREPPQLFKGAPRLNQVTGQNQPLKRSSVRN